MVNYKKPERMFENKNGLKAYNKYVDRGMITCEICEQAFTTAVEKMIHDRITKH